MHHLFPTWAPAGLPWLEFNLTAIGMVLLTCIIVIGLCVWMVKGISVNNPSRKQVVIEMVYDFIRNTVASTMDMKRGEKFVTLALTLFLFILIGNFLGIPLNISVSFTETTPFWESLGITQEVIDEHSVDGHGAHVAFWMSPTASPSVTIAMSLSIVLLSQILGFMYRGPVKHIKHFFEPNPVFLPLHIIEEGAKILTLGFRLYGNIFAKEVLIAVILTMPLVGFYAGGFLTLTIWQGFGMFVGAIQAFVFTTLSMVYIATQTAKH
ncbi:ATP synthase F0 subunit A [Desulfuribacillus stibiiarsenatis]|uniref:ATP synthase subunit a n=1 Tax=Desulfuribacillus stibiiarsenatis TaxID=1390249 RepID=A0A1E5L5L5_9FIRM|nr:F0F1 ATP synthase subunit A [Desulfuribacillus stibiiarsenatis]OEH85437.1 ATP synthase F0 subunit A [Desulfuribacillus stibiiarsenatis]